jgi:Fe-S-cluster containining protein
LIVIDNILVSDEVVSEQFVCDLNKCKGGCCEDGDSGAPLTNEELEMLRNYIDEIKPYCTEEGLKVLEKEGLYRYDAEFGWVTPTIGGRMCAYGFRDQQGIIKCGIEQAWLDKKISWKKPISCHLFPVKITRSKRQTQEYVNYEPRQDLCKAACRLGKQLKVPVHVFLKDALIRKYGLEFYTTLEAAALHVKKEKV